MIKPNMATMLGFMAMDAKVAQPVADNRDRPGCWICASGKQSLHSSLVQRWLVAGRIQGVRAKTRHGLRIVLIASS